MCLKKYNLTPIEKNEVCMNVIVVDEQGNEYEATYPKRAKGLVKNGRARFVDEHMICLLSPCPPENKTEDIIMSDNNENISSENVAKAKVQYTVEYILSQIADIQKQTTYLNEAITKLSIMSDGDSGDCGSPGNIQGQANAQAFGDIVRCRETTNQQMLKLYEKMYDNLTTSKSNTPVEFDKWNAISKLADVAMHDDDFAGERNEMLDSIRQILRENK